MQVCIITPWAVNCGIFTYSQNLIAELEKLGANVEVYPNTDDFTGLTKLARESNADVIHIQHEFGISMPNDSLFSIIAKLRSTGKAVVITMHTEDKPTTILLDGVVDAAILHNDIMGLEGKNTFSKFYKIPHGIPEISFEFKKIHYKEKFNIPSSSFVIGTCGFISSDRAKTLEDFVCSMVPFMKENKQAYLHIPMSAHRSDTNGAFAASIRKGLEDIAEENGFLDRFQMTSTFMDTEEFRERLNTLDLGFSYQGNLKAASNSGAAADIISCGVPCVVNNAKHFSHIAQYCAVVDGDISAVANRIQQIFRLNAKEYPELINLQKYAKKAIIDLGYSTAAKRHMEVYDIAIKEARKSSNYKTSAIKPIDYSAHKEGTIVNVTMPNSIWQILLLWRKLSILVNHGFLIRLILQNNNTYEALQLKYMLKGLIDVQFAEVGQSDDPRIVKLYSRNFSLNITCDVDSWLKQGKSFSNLLPFIDNGIGIDYEVTLGDRAKKAAQNIVSPEEAIVIAGGDVLKDVNNYNHLNGYDNFNPILVLGTQLQHKEVETLVEYIKTYFNVSVRSKIVDIRTMFACCEMAINKYVFSDFNECAMYYLNTPDIGFNMYLSISNKAYFPIFKEIIGAAQE